MKPRPIYNRGYTKESILKHTKILRLQTVPKMKLLFDSAAIHISFRCTNFEIRCPPVKLEVTVLLPLTHLVYCFCSSLLTLPQQENQLFFTRFPCLVRHMNCCPSFVYVNRSLKNPILMTTVSCLLLNLSTSYQRPQTLSSKSSGIISLSTSRRQRVCRLRSMSRTATHLYYEQAKTTRSRLRSRSWIQSSPIVLRKAHCFCHFH